MATWKSGLKVFIDMANAVYETVSDDSVRERLYEQFIEIFEEYNIDSPDRECFGIDPVLDKILKESGWVLENEDEDDDSLDFGDREDH
jgi:hypothetical protein